MVIITHHALMYVSVGIGTFILFELRTEAPKEAFNTNLAVYMVVKRLAGRYHFRIARTLRIMKCSLVAFKENMIKIIFRRISEDFDSLN